MKKYILITFVATLSIFAIQTLYLESTYSEFLSEKSAKIDHNVKQSIYLEYDIRSLNKKTGVDFFVRHIHVEDMSEKMFDSLIKLHPLRPMNKTGKPPKESEVYDTKDLMEKGVISSRGDITIHENQDAAYEKGRPIDVVVLDSILNNKLGGEYKTRIVIRNSKDSILSAIGEVGDYNYKSKPIQIGFRGHQFVEVSAYIPLSSYFTNMIGLIIASMLIISIPIISLILLMTTIKRKVKSLELREESVRGTIHDLKSPIASVVTILDVVKMMGANQDINRAVTNYKAVVGNLLNRIDLLLEVNRHDVGAIVVNKTLISGEVIEQHASQIVSLLKTSYNHKTNCNICIENRVDPNSSIYLDVLLFDTILTNLIENSLKYSKDSVDIKILFNFNPENHLVISVEDNGFGIEKKYQKKIFNQYFRIENRGIKGYGIGLSYLKTISKTHGGDISVESEFGKGSRFEVKLNIKD